MNQLTKQYLLLSSILICLLCSSCRLSKNKSSVPLSTVSLTTQQITPVLNDDGKTVKFKASIDVLKNHLTGLLLVKQIDSTTTHIVFLTELGMKMFDFEIKKSSGINTVYVFEPLNKPLLIEALKTNLKNMLLLDVFNKSVNSGINKKQQTVFKLSENNIHRIFVVQDTNRLLVQEVLHKKKITSLINYTYSTETKAYSHITCKQYGLVKFYFELNYIPISND